ncbi:enoyl-CoA hydratase/isomerase family protein [Entomomonas asaccharolytica]|uniref:3-hydroxyisobutyryl-CoA hydrolase n=1 Tax=Entomomonas asaccharolytica TaxID=2785331 RepID=A0A974NGJ4_9GAMM|nr:enoyl-CoA hydratase/isomerase family protein [Entomomonas asaccharolytica]QQP86189.1 enoyl-CoA hydratase/isomerase family protein [Entomomonas asaccharolytica]
MPVHFEELPCLDNYKIGVITLNSPKNLNALNYQITKAMYQQLEKWAIDTKLACVFLHSSSAKAFCAGGDVRQIVESCCQHLGEPDEVAHRFFSQEYQLDAFIHHYPKPIIGWGEGYVLGGGMGLLQGCSTRIVTPTSKLAMPEINIGLFPDVGAAWFLSRMPQKMGLFFALTASQLNANDALYFGWADRFLLNEQKNDLLQSFQQISWACNAEQQLQQLLKSLEQQALSQLPNAVWQPRLKIIKEALDQPDLPSICNAIINLQDSNDEILTQAATTLANGCPMTAWLIWEQLKRLSHCSITEVLEMDLVISQNCCKRKDFIEGVRARLIDKDNKPNWRWKSIEEVPFKEVDKHFCL